MHPRSLMVPPGIPEFAMRERRLAPGRVTVRGRAWSGLAEIERVELSADGGESWSDARLAPPRAPWAWRAGGGDWGAEPRAPQLCCPATGAAGDRAPPRPP